MHRALALGPAVFSALFSLIFTSPTYAYDRDKLMGSFLSIVMVRGYNPDGSLAYGSGVVVGENKVMTNCHIFRQTKQPWVSRGEDTYAIVSVQADRYHDVCLLTADNLPFKPIPLGKASDMTKGQEVVAIGHSSGTPAPLTSAGTLKSLYDYNNGKVIRTSARFAMGASGSGLFNSEGQLIGINTFKSPGRSAYFYALPVEWLAELQKLPVETKFPIDGKAFWEEEDLQKPFFMQMAIPEIKQDWAKLAEVAERWTKAEPGSTEAWYELGHARENMGIKTEAEQAYRQSVALDAHNTDALFRIGVLASEKGDKIEMHSINLALLDIDKELADEFSKIVGCATQC
ncbi:MAG: trypsin-like peptidase domain-containing protein [Methylophilaceae bacterium]